MVPVLPLVKLGIAAAAGVPVSKVVGSIIRNNVATPDSPTVKIGGYVITMMLSAPLMKTVDNVVDNALEVYTKVKNAEKPADESTEDQPVDTE